VAQEAMMASSPERRVDGFTANLVDFRNLLLGAWRMGRRTSRNPQRQPPPTPGVVDDPQWITWADASAETAWEAIEVALTLGGMSSSPRTR
jgi:hypothetical protein